MTEHATEFPRAFRVDDRYDVQGWTQHLAMTRVATPDGEECVVWIGTVDLILSDSGGWYPDDAAAIGVHWDGSVDYETEWRAEFGELAELSQVGHPKWSLARALWFAAQVAAAASGFLPAVGAAFERGKTFEQFVAWAGPVLDAELLRRYPDSPRLRENETELALVAVELLWLSEEIRRSPSQG